MDTYSIVYTSFGNLYEQYEASCGSTYNRRCIDGKVTGCGNCVGYCRFAGHPGFLTEKLRKQHNCIGKACYYYLGKTKNRNAAQRKSTIQESFLSAACGRLAR